jgi:hypothetical protein
MVSGVVAALDNIVDLPGWLVGAAVGIMVLSACTFFAAAWRESRATGQGFLRTIGSALWDTVRLVFAFAF